MSRKKNRNRNRQPSTGPKASNEISVAAVPKVKVNSDPANEIEQLSAAAAANVTESDLKTLDDKPPASPDTSVKDLITKGNEALSLLEVQRERAKKEEETAKAKQAELEEARNNLESDREKAQQQLAKAEEKAAVVEKAKKAVEQREKALLEREETLLKHELDADAGFAQRNRQALESLDREAQTLREEFSNHMRG
jgi:hypothetical protein